MGSVDLKGTQVGRYMIEESLGSGGMGEVYRALDTQLHRSVALKKLSNRYREDEQYRRYLLNEARRASAFNHSSIAAVYDIFDHGGELFIVMEYVEGTNLRTRMDVPLSVQEFLPIAIQCASGLSAAHQKGVVHGDLKPENVMVVGETGDIKLCDFGLSRRTPARVDDKVSITTTNLLPEDVIAGTPAYMAPESLSGAATPRSDVFALGVVFYELLAGRHPFRDATAGKTAQRIAVETPPPLDGGGSGVPTYIATIVSKMLQKDPQARYADAGEVLADLESAVAKTQAVPRWKTFAVRTLALTLAVLAGTVLFMWSDALRSGPADAGSASVIRTLAVLPFDAVGSTKIQQVQTEGLSETLNAVLVKLSAGKNLQVLAAKDVQARGVKSADDARQELGATLVLKGTIQYFGKLVRVNCILSDGISGNQIDADNFTVDSGDPFLLQDRIIDVAVRMLDIRLLPVDQAALQQHGTKEPGAYEFYLQGRGYLLNFDREDSLDSAIQLFNSALKVDSKYSLAFAGLGEAHWRQYEATKDQKFIEPARSACERAVSLGTELAGPHLCLGTVYLGTGGYENAVKEFNRALEIEPAMEVAYVNLGMAYQRLNQKDKAEQTLNKAIDLKPQYWATHSALGLFYYNDGKYALAQQKFQQAAKLAPDSYRAHSAMGVVYDKLGRTKEAIAAFEKSMSIRQNYIAASNLGTVYLLNGLYQKAVTTYRQALRINSNDFVVWGNLGSALHWSHQDQDAAAAYEEARKRAEERLKVDRRNYTVLMRLAEYNGALGSKSESLSYLRRALQEAPDDLDVLLKAAVVYEYNLKQRDDALQMLEKLIQRSQEAPNKQVDQEAVWTQIDRSPSLSELRKDPRFDKLLKLRNTP